MFMHGFGSLAVVVVMVMVMVCTTHPKLLVDVRTGHLWSAPAFQEPPRTAGANTFAKTELCASDMEMSRSVDAFGIEDKNPARGHARPITEGFSELDNMERANVPGYSDIVNSVFDKPKSLHKLTVFMPGFTMSCLRSLGLLGQAIKRVKDVNPYSMLCMKVPYALKVNHQIQLIDHTEMGTDLKQESAEVYFKSMEEIDNFTICKDLGGNDYFKIKAYIRAEVAPFVISTATAPEMLDRDKFLDSFAELAMPKVEYGKKESPADRKTRLRVVLDNNFEFFSASREGSRRGIHVDSYSRGAFYLPSGLWPNMLLRDQPQAARLAQEWIDERFWPRRSQVQTKTLPTSGLALPTFGIVQVASTLEIAATPRLKSQSLSLGLSIATLQLPRASLSRAPILRYLPMEPSSETMFTWNDLQNEMEDTVQPDVPLSIDRALSVLVIDLKVLLASSIADFDT
ncbi:hypothetical protein PG995_006595 [Apiospora arundinis]